MRNLILAAGISAAVLAAGLTKIADLDFWWHLKTGQLIVASHSIPRTDVYSITAFGREYVDHEWLFQVIQYVTYAIPLRYFLVIVLEGDPETRGFALAALKRERVVALGVPTVDEVRQAFERK